MGRPFIRDVSAIAESLDKATLRDVRPLVSLIESLRDRPLLTVGSGGSYTSAVFLSLIHEELTGIPSKAVTPLEFVLSPIASNGGVVLLSASGKNQDILQAAEHALRYTQARLAGVIAYPRSPLATTLSRRHIPYYECDAAGGRDGFLALNSLVACCTALCIAYSQITGGDFPTETLHEVAINESARQGPIYRDLLTDRSLIVLSGRWGKPAAVDLESKFAEAALGHVSVTDFRNFGHGRHFWLASRPQATSLIAMKTPEVAALSDRTVRQIPVEIATVSLETSLPGPYGALELLLRSFGVVRQAGELVGIDPGKPGVPEFGRRLYSLPVSLSRRSPTSNLDMIVSRKWASTGPIPRSVVAIYRRELDRFFERLDQADFMGVVVDFDGTIRSEKDGPNEVHLGIGEQLTRLAEDGLCVGVATGRGKSATAALRDSLPSAIWPRILVGYYNGAVVLPLDQNLKDLAAHDSLSSIAKELVHYEPFREQVEVVSRPAQITLRILGRYPLQRAKREVREIVHTSLLQSQVRVVDTGHSIDIIPMHVSKANVRSTVLGLIGDASGRSVLSIGNQGLIGGNDYELLSEDFGLSVDLVSTSPFSCWNIAPSHSAGPDACTGYLRALEPQGDQCKFRVDVIKKWWDDHEA